MNIETLGARVVLLQQQVNLHVEQISAIGDNLKILRGHLAESQHWLSQLNEEAKALEPVPVNEEEACPVEEELAQA